jgi:hypothetical protein
MQEQVLFAEVNSKRNGIICPVKGTPAFDK